MAGAPNGTSIKRDGALLQGAALGVALPVDPGEHVLSVQAPGGAEKVVKVDIALGQSRLIELEAPPAPSSSVSPGPQTEASGSAAPSLASSAAPSTESAGSRRTLAYAIGGLGIAGLVVGGVTGALVLGKKGTVTDNCDGSACRNSVGYEAARSAKTMATVSTVGFGVGVVGVAVSAVLLFTGGTSDRRSGSAPHLQPLVTTSAQGVWAGVERSF